MRLLAAYALWIVLAVLYAFASLHWDPVLKWGGVAILGAAVIPASWIWVRR